MQVVKHITTSKTPNISNQKSIRTDRGGKLRRGLLTYSERHLPSIGLNIHIQMFRIHTNKHITVAIVNISPRDAGSLTCPENVEATLIHYDNK